MKPQLLLYGLLTLKLVLTLHTVAAAESISSQAKPNNSDSSHHQPAIFAQLNTPQGIIVGSDGNLYIADVNNHRIRKVNSKGTINTIAGDGTSGYYGDHGPAQLAQLNEPTDIAFDSQGHLYIADSKNHVIRKIDKKGTITTIAGNTIPGYSGDNGLAIMAQLNLPVQITVDSHENLYITDQNNHVIRKVDHNGVITTIAGDGTKGYSE